MMVPTSTFKYKKCQITSQGLSNTEYYCLNSLTVTINEAGLHHKTMQHTTGELHNAIRLRACCIQQLFLELRHL